MATSHSSGGLNIAKELAAMRQMNARELQAKYAEVFGEATRSRHKEQLIRKIAWRMQANAEGGLSERARRRAGVQNVKVWTSPNPIMAPLASGPGVFTPGVQ